MMNSTLPLAHFTTRGTAAFEEQKEPVLNIHGGAWLLILVLKGAVYWVFMNMFKAHAFIPKSLAEESVHWVYEV